MKIVKVYEPGQHKSTVVKGQVHKVYEKLGYYVMVVKARCGNHRVEIHKKTHPSIYAAIEAGKVRGGLDLIQFLEFLLFKYEGDETKI